MLSSLYIAATLLTAGTLADYNCAASDVYSVASDINNDVSKWSSEDGIRGALSIQNKFYQLSSALDDVSQAVDEGCPDDIDVQATNHLASELSKLLGTLVEKADDFAALSLTGVISEDLKQISGSTTDIVDHLVKDIRSDASRWNDVEEQIGILEICLSNANQAYDLVKPEFIRAASANLTVSTTKNASSSLTIAKSTQSHHHNHTHHKNETTAKHSQKHETSPHEKNAATLLKLSVSGILVAVAAVLI